MFKRLYIFTFFIVTAIVTNAQELDCNLRVNYDQIRTSENQIFDQMEQDLMEFVNNQRWGDDVIAPEERIKCDIVVNIKKMSGQSNFVADVMVQSSRPVYGTDYDTPVFNYIDQDVPFEYQQGQPLFFTTNAFTSNITSIMAFYVYLVLGYDYDTFAKNGGTSYFDKANDVVLNAVQSGDNGWTSDGKNRNRYNLITNILNPQYSTMREGYYKYHRLAMDMFEKDQAGARKKITEVITSLKRLYNLDPNAPILSCFFEAKAIEIAGVYQKAPMNEKQAVLKILRDIDSSNMDKYNQMMKATR